MTARCVRTGKRAYPTPEGADTILGRIWATCRPGRRLETRVYRCEWCEHWHLTSKPLPTMPRTETT